MRTGSVLSDLRLRHIHSSRPRDPRPETRAATKMVKLGSNLVDKSSVKSVSEDGFDTIPLIAPLDPSQLPLGDKVVVKTRAEFDSEKQKKSRSPKITEFSISIIEGASERLKVSLVVLCALAVLVCVVFLVVYKVYQYEQPCPENFMYAQGRCTPVGLYGAFSPQGPLTPQGRLFTLINRYNLNRQSITRSVSPWISIVQEEREEREETHKLE